jgi:hypothetical protein
MARVGYFDGSSWAHADRIAAPGSAINAIHQTIHVYLQGILMALDFSSMSITKFSIQSRVM